MLARAGPTSIRLGRTHRGRPGPMPRRNAVFLLTDRSDAAKAELLAACRRHLTGHPGTVHFACGTLAEALDRPVNDRDWDVALHIAFESQAAHDAYQEAP